MLAPPRCIPALAAGGGICAPPGPPLSIPGLPAAPMLMPPTLFPTAALAALPGIPFMATGTPALTA